MDTPSLLASQLAWVPILVGLLLLSSIIFPYFIAVSLGHVTAFLPYISDTGTLPPESCVFGQLLNMTAAAALTCMFIRYKQVCLVSKGNSCLNRFGMLLGLLAAIGMSMVANFQETNVIVVHGFGALMCFGLGSIYAMIHTWITFTLNGLGRMTYLRLMLSVSSIIFLILTTVYSSQTIVHYKDADNPLKWKPTEEGFVQHEVATMSEWLLAISFQLYFFTFIPDFRWLGVVVEVKPESQMQPGVDKPSSKGSRHRKKL